MLQLILNAKNQAAIFGEHRKSGRDEVCDESYDKQGHQGNVHRGQ